jgi:hypothetical protein
MKKFLSLLFIVLCAAFGFAAAPPSTATIGQIKNVTGQVTLERGNLRREAAAGNLVEEADIIITGAKGSVGITLVDNSRLSAGPNSRIDLKRFQFNPTTQQGESVTEIRRGTLAIVSGQIAKGSPDAMKVQTPTTILGVRGTAFVVKVEE